MSSSESPQRSPEQEEKSKPHKIFVTNLEVEVPASKLEQELEQKFSRYGKLDSVVVKKSYNNEYSFAFIEYKEGEDASVAVNELNNTSLCGKKMKVELQDNARRRKGGNQTCYVCGKAGHYARNCRQNKEDHERRSSRSEDHHRKKSKKKKHHHHRHRSSSNESDSPKQSKKHSKKVKKHSKHKKSKRKHSASSSD